MSRRPILLDAPTVRTTLAAGAYVAAICRQCGRDQVLDLPELERRGLGDTKILALRLRCPACRSTDHDVVVGGRYQAPF